MDEDRFAVMVGKKGRPPNRNTREVDSTETSA